MKIKYQKIKIEVIPNYFLIFVCMYDCLVIGFYIEIKRILDFKDQILSKKK